MKKSKYIIGIFLGFSLLSLMGGFIWQKLSSTQSSNFSGHNINIMKEVFPLIDHTGRQVTEQIFREKPTVIFFGYGHCPDICPTTLASAGGWLDALGADAEKLQFIFITVDPERDTEKTLSDYMKSFDTRLVAVTGTPDKIASLRQSFHAYAQKVSEDGGSGLLNHTMMLYFVSRHMELRGLISPNEGDDNILIKLQKLIKEDKG